MGVLTVKFASFRDIESVMLCLLTYKPI